MRVPSFVHTAGVLALGFVVTTPTSVSALQLTCRDGDPNTVVSPRGLGGQPFSNHDEAGDGVCTFATCSVCPFTRGCVGPEMGICPDGGQTSRRPARVVAVVP